MRSILTSIALLVGLSGAAFALITAPVARAQPPEASVSAAFPYESRYVEVLGSHNSCPHSRPTSGYS